MRILQAFADMGAEDPALSRHGEVVRLSIAPELNRWSQTIQADATRPPLPDSETFDLAIAHPPCGGVSPMSDTGSGDSDDWPDLVPEARELVRTVADEWIIENKPRDSLDSEVVLSGHMFGLDIEYKRAFETSFAVEQPPMQDKLAETSPFFYTEKPAGWWASVKGSSTEFTAQHLAKNTIPAAYLDYLLRYYYEAVDSDDRPDYTNYNDEMDTRRSRERNAELSAFGGESA